MGFTKQKLLGALCSLIFCCTPIGKSVPALADTAYDGYVREVPAGTTVSIKFCSDVKSNSVQDADEFSARTIEDVRINGEIVVPSSSIIRGRCFTVPPLAGLKRSGMSQLKFDTIKFPDGTLFPFVARVPVRSGKIRLSRGTSEIFIPARACLLNNVIVGTVLCVFGANPQPDSVLHARNENLYTLPKDKRPLLNTGIADRRTVVLIPKNKRGFEILNGDETILEFTEGLRVLPSVQ